MTLLQTIANMWDRLAPAGWDDLLLTHGLALPKTNASLDEWTKALAATLPSIRRDVPGFRDFTPQALRAIEPGRKSFVSCFGIAIGHSDPFRQTFERISNPRRIGSGGELRLRASCAK
jgi:hypothetical protein